MNKDKPNKTEIEELEDEQLENAHGGATLRDATQVGVSKGNASQEVADRSGLKNAGRSIVKSGGGNEI